MKKDLLPSSSAGPPGKCLLFPAVFLDRDGTLIKDLNYAADQEQVVLLPGAAEALRTMRELGFKLIVISNQSGVGRRMISPKQAAAVHSKFVCLLRQAGVALDGVYYCPHAPSAECDCRKPLPGLVLLAAKEHSIDLTRSVFVGDKQTDVETGTNAGMRSLLLTPRRTDGAPDWNEVLRRISDKSERAR
jgi:D-glycero-D-manno-heptose 1,7-bisphosphate phosphatase